MKDLKNWLNGGTKTESDERIKSAEQALEHFGGKSESELLSELKSSFESGKADGSITPESIRHFTDTVSPMLSSEQKKKLAQLIKSLS